MHVEFYTKAFFVALAVLVGVRHVAGAPALRGRDGLGDLPGLPAPPAARLADAQAARQAGRIGRLITGLTPFAVLTPLTLLAFQFVDQARALVHYVRGSDFKLDGSILMRLEQYPVIGPLARLAREELMVSAADIQDWLGRATETALRSVASIGSGLVLGALGTLVAFFFMLFLLFFFLRDGTRMFDRLQRLIPVPEDHREQLFDHLSSVTRGVFYGIGLTAIFQGILVGIGFWIAGMPSPVVFGVIAGILALLPAGGAAIVWIPAVLYLAAVGHWGMFIFMLIWGVIISTSDNFLRPDPGVALRAGVGVHGVRGRGGRHRRLRRHRHRGGAGVPRAGGGDHRIFRREGHRAEQAPSRCAGGRRAAAADAGALSRACHELNSRVSERVEHIAMANRVYEVDDSARRSPKNMAMPAKSSVAAIQRRAWRALEHALVQAVDFHAGLAREVGVHPAGQHRVHLDVVRGPRGRERFRELHDAALARAIGRRKSGAEDRQHRIRC